MYVGRASESVDRESDMMMSIAADGPVPMNAQGDDDEEDDDDDGRRW